MKIRVQIFNWQNRIEQRIANGLAIADYKKIHADRHIDQTAWSQLLGAQGGTG